MSRIVDNLIAYRVLTMLVTPFTDTKAFKLGIIDAKGNTLRKTTELKTTEEREEFTYLHRLVFNIKKILLKLPGGDSKIKNIIAALWLIKEYYQSGDRTTSLLEGKLKTIVEKLDEGVILVEEEVEVKRFLQYISEDGIGAVPTNTTAGVAGLSKETGGPVIKKKDIKKYQSMNRRPAPVETKS